MLNLRVLIIKEKPPADVTADSMFSVVGLEHFVAAQGKTIQEALNAFSRVCATAQCLANTKQASLFAGINPAPARFHDLYASGKAQGLVVSFGGQAGAECHGDAVLAPSTIAA